MSRKPAAASPRGVRFAIISCGILAEAPRTSCSRAMLLRRSFLRLLVLTAVETSEALIRTTRFAAPIVATELRAAAPIAQFGFGGRVRKLDGKA